MKLKKYATPGMIIFAIVGLLAVNYFAENLAIMETTALVLSQYTQRDGDTCVYYDGISTCEVSISQCIGTEKYAISLGLCGATTERKISIGRAGIATFDFSHYATEITVKPGVNVPIFGEATVSSAGTYIIEAGLVDYSKWKEEGRLGIINVPPAYQSICDGIEYFASSRVKDVDAGDVLKFNLNPKAPTTDGTYYYDVYLANGCIVGPEGNPQAKIVAQSPIQIKVVVDSASEGGVIPPKVIDTPEVWKDIQKDLEKLKAWIVPYKNKIKTTYVLYGILALVGLIVLMIILSAPKAPKRGPPQQPSYGRYEQRYY